MATKEKTDDLTLPERDLLLLSQEIKQEALALRDRRRAIADEIVRRHQVEVIKSKLGDMTPEEREMARAMLDEAAD